ncbi:hypothetical protein DFH09DRAFT_1314852 [Mycena vulgaris]|nr:hypothetical protein DFH09DRAFT_1314852 [Mycena vulgaris]
MPNAVFPKPGSSRKQITSDYSTLQHQITVMGTRLEKLERSQVAATQSLAELPDLYDRVEDMSFKIEELESALLKATSGTILTDKDQQVVIQARDNNINACPIMYSIMAISNEDTSVLPDPVQKPNNGGPQWWVATGIPDELALRPDFTISWSKNKAWHKKLLDKVRSDGHNLYPSCTQAVIDGLSDKDMYQRVSRTTFKHLKEKYQLQGKSDHEKTIDKQFKRREGRKKTKSTKRTAVRNQYPNLAHHRYDFIFHPAFQSTDCSTKFTSASDGGAADSDADGAITIRRLKSWHPAHRDTEYANLVDDIDAREKAHAKANKPKAKGKKSGGNQYIMVRARTKLRPTRTIPRLEDGPKMLASFINEAWLAELPQESWTVLAEFVAGSDDDGYESEWEVLPRWEPLSRKGKNRDVGARPVMAGEND